MEGIVFQAEPIRYLAWNFIAATAAYLDIGTSGVIPAVNATIDKPVRLVLIQNMTDANLMFSFGGLVDHFILPPSGFFSVDMTTNRTSNLDGWYLPVNSKLCVRRLAVPTSGAVYFSAFHGVR